VYDDRAELRSVVRPANRHLLGERFAAGGIFGSGPVADNAAPGALLVGTADRPGRPSGLLCQTEVVPGLVGVEVVVPRLTPAVG